MTERLKIPVKVVNGDKWADLNALALTHEVCGEYVKLKEMRFSFAAGHRVQLWSFKKNVHLRVPTGIELDIADVPSSKAPRRR